MKKLVLCALWMCLVASVAFAGVGYSGKEVKQVGCSSAVPGVVR